MTQLETSKPNQTSFRRTLLKAAAWATPVITIAVAAPLAAASINDASLALQQQANNGSLRTTSNRAAPPSRFRSLSIDLDSCA